MAAFTLLFFPGHADEGPLDVVVNYLWTSTWSLFDLLFICRVACQKRSVEVSLAFYCHPGIQKHQNEDTKVYSPGGNVLNTIKKFQGNNSGVYFMTLVFPYD